MKAPRFLQKILFILIFITPLSSNVFSQEYIKEKFFLLSNTLGSVTGIKTSWKAYPEKQALYIYNFIRSIDWPNANELTAYNIGVLGDTSNLVFDELVKEAESKKVKDLPITVKRLDNLDDLENIQVLYFDNESTLKLEDVYKAIGKKPVLMVTQGYPFGKSMINFVMDEDKVQYELNEKKCNQAGLKVSKLLSIVAIKSEKEWDSLLEKMENLADTQDETIKIDRKDLAKIINEQKRLLVEIEANTKKLETQKETLKKQQEELSSKELLLAETKKEIDKQKQLIGDQLRKIAIQEKNLANINKNVAIKQQELVVQQNKLEAEKQSLLAIQKEYADIENKLKDKERLVSEQNQKIDDQIDDILKKSSKIEEQKEIIWLSLLFIIIVSILGVLAYRSYRLKNKANKLVMLQKEEIEEQHKVLEEQHKEITDSINYAKRIQDAILPPLKLVKGYMPDSFILYKPKDIVAGDFYWMEGINNLIIFAAADCTGHGVPGAMVSVVCHNAMNRSVKEFMLVKPSDILDKTREIVMETFEKSAEDVNDGMDIALCSINTESNKLNFSGANNGLYVVRDGDIIEIKPDKQPIGNYKDAKPFTNHEMSLQKGDVIYAFTDGFPDQFGGPKGKKFMYKPFRNMLIDIHQNPMDQQHETLVKAFSDWKGDIEQIDDVCVIGVRI